MHANKIGKSFVEGIVQKNLKENDNKKLPNTCLNFELNKNKNK